MSNLITNAIKYSPNNSRVKIRAEIARDPNYLEVTVEDNGIGIAPEHQKMIFERFYRIENQVHTVKGTGLGLHLVKVAIEKHHQGQVFVKSKQNEGSTFGFWLPIENVKITEQKPSNTPQQQKNQTPNEYQEYKIEKIEDYKAKAEFDAKFIGQNLKEPTKITSNNPIKKDGLIHQAASDDEWEITFEVRDN